MSARESKPAPKPALHQIYEDKGIDVDPLGSVILRTATRALLPVVLLLSIVVLFQGHNKPGGGFIAGLMVGSCVAFHGIAFGVVATRRILRADPRSLIGVGLCMSLVSVIIPLLFHKPLMTSVWASIPLPGMDSLKVGTPMLFDVGVFVLVTGVASEMILSLLRRAYATTVSEEPIPSPDADAESSPEPITDPTTRSESRRKGAST